MNEALGRGADCEELERVHILSIAIILDYPQRELEPYLPFF